MAACAFEGVYVRADTVADLLYVDLDQLEWRRLPAGQEKRMNDGAQKLYLGMGVDSGGLFPVYLQGRNDKLWLFRSQKFTNEVLVRRVEAGRKQLSIYASLLDQGVAFQALNSFTGEELCAVIMWNEGEAIRGHNLRSALREKLVSDGVCTEYTQLALTTSKSNQVINAFDTVFHPKPRYEPEIKRRKFGKQPKGWWISEMQFLPVSKEGLARLMQ